MRERQYERRNALHNRTHSRALTSARNPADLIVSAPNSLHGPFSFSFPSPFPFHLKGLGLQAGFHLKGLQAGIWDPLEVGETFTLGRKANQSRGKF